MKRNLRRWLPYSGLVLLLLIAGGLYLVTRPSPLPESALYFPPRLTLWVRFEGSIAMERSQSAPQRWRFSGMARGAPIHPPLYQFTLDSLHLQQEDAPPLLHYFHDKQGLRHYQIAPHLSPQERLALFHLLHVDLEQSQLYDDESLLQEAIEVLLSYQGGIQRVQLTSALKHFLLVYLRGLPFAPQLFQWLENPSHLPPMKILTHMNRRERRLEEAMFTLNFSQQGEILGNSHSDTLALEGKLEFHFQAEPIMPRSPSAS